MKNKYFFALLLAVISTVFASSQVTYTAAPTDAEINTTLTSPNITITGGVLNSGNRTNQIALFSGGTAAGLAFDSGVFFNTGSNTTLLTGNTVTNTTVLNAGVYNDPDLVAIDPTANNDVASYSFNVKIGPKATILQISFIFGSEEFPDWVGSQYNDILGLFISGPGITGTANLAKLPNGNNVRINTVNYGIMGSSSQSPFFGYDGTQSALYINNGHNTATTAGPPVRLVANTNPGPFPVNVQFNGLTKALTYNIANLTPGGDYVFKIAIADTADGSYDSGIFIQSNSLIAYAAVAANDDVYTLCNGASTASVFLNDTYNGAAPTSADVSVSGVGLPAGFTVNADGTISVATTVAAGTYSVTYEICDKTSPGTCATATATITVNSCVCYSDANTGSAGTPAIQGITLLQRAGSDNGNWPMVRTSAHTVLESNTKGFVITRLTTAQVAAIVSPQEGMMVYDTDEKCLKLYDGSAWSCFTTATCPPPTAPVGTVTSPTGKIWMDRNLGASQVAASSTDAAAYGDLYQWGRGTDGHQLRTSAITAVLSSTDSPGHGDFITPASGDWRSPSNDNLWQGVSGINNPCPGGYRIPTITELTDEIASFSTLNSAGAFNSALKIPAGGYREYYDGSYYNYSTASLYWSSTVQGTNSHYIYITDGGSGDSSVQRGYGFSVRCIKD